MLSLIRRGPVEGEAGRQSPTQPLQARDGFLPTSVAANLELPCSGDPDLDLIALLEIQRFDNDSGQTYRKTVSPL
jgi:hypothetical protein